MGNRDDRVNREVLNPLSDIAVTGGNAARLDTLNGKTVCEVYTTGDYGGDRTFPVIREMLRSRFPDVKSVPFTGCSATFQVSRRGLPRSRRSAFG